MLGKERLDCENFQQSVVRFSYPETNYRMNTDEVSELCQDFLRLRFQSGQKGYDNGFGCYLIQPDSTYSNLGRHVETVVFEETFGNNPDSMSQQYGDYDSASYFILVIDHAQKMPVATLRVIVNSVAGLKSFNDIHLTGLDIQEDQIIREYGLDISKTIDIGTLAVLPEYRAAFVKADAGGKEIVPISLIVYKALYTYFLSSGKYSHAVAMIDQKAERSMKKMHFPFMPVLGTDYFEYEGSKKSRFLIAQNDRFFPSVYNAYTELNKHGDIEDQSRKIQFLAQCLKYLCSIT